MMNRVRHEHSLQHEQRGVEDELRRENRAQQRVLECKRGTLADFPAADVAAAFVAGLAP